MKFGVVAIGRNEGERLRICLHSLALSGPNLVVYVDFGSTDGSPQWARDQGVEVVELDMTLPFTAARARNVGFHRLREMAPDLVYVQFIDGDCELIPGWTEQALSFLVSHLDVAIVTGRRRERYPERSVYNWLRDRDWDGPLGELRICGGDVMMRAHVLEAVGGYRDDVLAGEDNEMCVRVRAAGWRIWRLQVEMTVHDAAMTRFGQWWRRTVRTGHGFAQGAYLHGAPPERHFVWESRRAWLWGIWLPLACLVATIAFWPWGLCSVFIYPLQVLRQIVRIPGPLDERVRVAFFDVLQRFPEGLGQIRFLYDRLFGRQVRLIEYK